MASGHDSHDDGHGHDDHGHGDDLGHGDDHGSGGDLWVVPPIVVGVVIAAIILAMVGLASGASPFT